MLEDRAIIHLGQDPLGSLASFSSLLEGGPLAHITAIWPSTGSFPTHVYRRFNEYCRLYTAWPARYRVFPGSLASLLR